MANPVQLARAFDGTFRVAISREPERRARPELIRHPPFTAPAHVYLPNDRRPYVCSFSCSPELWSYIRYLVPAFPLMLFGFAGYLHALRREQSILYRTVIGATVVTILSGVFLLPSSGYWHKDFCLSPLRFNSEAAEYIEQNAPARVMVDYLNRGPRRAGRIFLQRHRRTPGRPTLPARILRILPPVRSGGSAEAVKKQWRPTASATSHFRELRRAEHAAARDFVKRYTEERFRRGCVHVADKKRNSHTPCRAPGNWPRPPSSSTHIGIPSADNQSCRPEIRSWPSWSRCSPPVLLPNPHRRLQVRCSLRPSSRSTTRFAPPTPMPGPAFLRPQVRL